MASLVHAFVMSRVDYCNVVYAGAPKATTDKLQRVLNTADRVVTDTRKFGRGLKQMIHSELHWLDAPECINYISLVCYASLSGWNCFMVGLYRGTLPPQSLRLPQDIIFVLLPFVQFVVPSYRLSSYGRLAFTVAGPMTWNSLPRH